MEAFELTMKNQFFVDRFNKNKIIMYKDLRYNSKHNSYEFYNRYEKVKLGFQYYC